MSSPTATGGSALALPLRAMNVSSKDGWDFGWCVVDATDRVLGYCMTEAQAKQLVAPFAETAMVQKNIGNSAPGYVESETRENEVPAGAKGDANASASVPSTPARPAGASALSAARLPEGWREALREIRVNLDAGGWSTSNRDFLREHGGALLDKVEEVLESLPSSGAVKVCPRCGDAAKCSSPGCPLAQNAAARTDDFKEALNIGLAALGYLNPEQNDKHWNTLERKLREIEARSLESATAGTDDAAKVWELVRFDIAELDRPEVANAFGGELVNALRSTFIRGFREGKARG